jgi:hypothetical protein
MADTSEAWTWCERKDEKAISLEMSISGCTSGDIDIAAAKAIDPAIADAYQRVGVEP